VSGEDPLRRALRDARTIAGRTSRQRLPAERRREPGYTGADADERDPQPLGAEIERLVAEAGWRPTMPAATLMGAWDRLVGAEVAAHCRPERLVDGELVLVAESTAWATQLRLLARPLLARLAAELGAGVVERIRVNGPVTPNWAHGPRRVTGRGPRDTYG
jgi:predicted nucleic acid-binding Zn ribbon protein